MSTVKNYSKMSDFHATWASVEEFCTANILQDGVHTIHAGSVEIEIFLGGAPFAAAQKLIPVFFNGAIVERNRLEPPFFSGGSVSKQAETPFIAVSDPLVDSNNNINIAWYAGRRGENLQRHFTQLFRQLAERFDKELLFTGASAGGFAAIYYAAKLGERASVFAWNPQTDITAYLEMFARPYLQEAGVSTEALADSNWASRAKAELSGEIELTLPPSTELLKTGKTLILQNRTDWHLQEHLLPWLDQDTWQEVDGGAYLASPNHLVMVADYAEGHDPIPAGIIGLLLADLLHTDAPVQDLLDESDNI